jgi:hypothetical protein
MKTGELRFHGGNLPSHFNDFKLHLLDLNLQAIDLGGQYFALLLFLIIKISYGSIFLDSLSL